jgi:hypothetical protein
MMANLSADMLLKEGRLSAGRTDREKSVKVTA